MDLLTEFPFVEDEAFWADVARLADALQRDHDTIREWYEIEGYDRIVHSFQFLAWPDRDEPSALERFAAMAQRIRANFRRPDGQNGVGHFGLEFIPADERANHPRQRTLARMSNLTGDFMANVYASMLHSQDNLFLEGFTVRVADLGAQIRDLSVGGYGRTGNKPHGHPIVPKRLKDRVSGIGCHPREAQFADQARLLRNCGPRALLLAKQGEVYFDPQRRYVGRWAKAFERLVEDAEALARLAGLEDGRMALQDIGKVLALEGWKDRRVVVFNECKKVMVCQAGEAWRWPVEQPRDQPDPMTLHLFLDVFGQGHYWWVEFPKGMLGRICQLDRYTNCYACFTHLNAYQLASHECKLDGCQMYQCRICRFFFTSAEGLAAHHDEAVTYAIGCEACGRTQFNGITCFEAHHATNCLPPPLPNGAEWHHCQQCFRRYRSDCSHNCLDFGECSNCLADYTSWQDKRDHRCYLQPLDSYWQPVTYKEREDGEFEPIKVETHWAYDFETTRGLRLAKDVFRHEVMAWAVCLFVVDETTRNFLRSQHYKDHYRSLAEAAMQVHEDVACFDDVPGYPDYLYLSGTKLESFIYVTEKVLVTSIRSTHHKPILWAHNGSKFDAKFVLDFYLNVMHLELAGDKYERDWGARRMPVQQGQEIQWKEQRSVKRKDVVRVSGIGSKILQLKVRGVTYRCSHAHHAMPLRALPAAFGLPKDMVAKGEFPYALLKRDNWALELQGMPALELYDVNSMEGKRRLEVAHWWVEEQMRLGVQRDVIVGALKAAGVVEIAVDEAYVGKEEVGVWNFRDELWKYLATDVIVLAKCMEMYHAKTVELHQSLWEKYADRKGKVVSPLSCATSPSFALRMYRTWFMPVNALAILKPHEAEFIRKSLRGGRTDKRAHYVELKHEGDAMAYVDFVSLYPSVMDCAVHADPETGFEGTHYPVGPPTSESWHTDCTNASLTQRMGNKTGFLKVDTVCKRYVTHPTLHSKGAFGEGCKDEKLVFANMDHQEEIYAWPELQEAMRCGEVEVVRVHEVILFEKGSSLFAEYIHFFFEVKDQAGKAKNAGLKAMAKLLLNSLWGKLGQRSYSVREWVVDKARLDYLFQKFERKELELVRFVHREADRVWFEYQPVVDTGNLNNTAVQAAAFVSMWGRVMLHRKLLSVHGQRVLYCDTDSAIVYLRPGDSIQGLGDGIGMLQNEVESILDKAGFEKGVNFQRAFIREAVFVAPKTYALRIACRVKKDFVYDKVVCKGFEPSFANRQEIHFDSMKDLVWSTYDLKAFVGSKRRLRAEEERMGKRKEIQDSGRVGFLSSMSTNQIAPMERRIAKKMYGKYTKGETIAHMPRLVKPFGLEAPLRTFLDEGAGSREHFD